MNDNQSYPLAQVYYARVYVSLLEVGLLNSARTGVFGLNSA